MWDTRFIHLFCLSLLHTFVSEHFHASWIYPRDEPMQILLSSLNKDTQWSFTLKQSQHLEIAERLVCSSCSAIRMRAECTSRSRLRDKRFYCYIIIIARMCTFTCLPACVFLMLSYSNGLISASWSCAEELFLFTTLPSRSMINFALKFHPTPPGNLSKQYDHIGFAFGPSTSPLAMTVPLNPFSRANFLMSALFANSCPPNCPHGYNKISSPSLLYFFSSATSPS